MVSPNYPHYPHGLNNYPTYKSRTSFPHALSTLLCIAGNYLSSLSTCHYCPRALLLLYLKLTTLSLTLKLPSMRLSLYNQILWFIVSMSATTYKTELLILD